MKVYAVVYTDGSWGNTGNYILGIFDNKKQAEDYVEYVKDIKDFDNLSGSGVNIEEYDLNVRMVNEDDLIMYFN